MGAVKSKNLQEPFCDEELQFNIAQVKKLHQRWSHANIGFVVSREQLAEFLGDTAKSSRIYDALLTSDETSLNVMKLMAAMCMFSQESAEEKLEAMFHIFDLRKEKKVYFEEWAIAMILCAQAFIRVTGDTGLVDENSLDSLAADAFASVGIKNADESSFMDRANFQTWASSVAPLDSDGYLMALMKKVIVSKEEEAAVEAETAEIVKKEEDQAAAAASDSDSYSDEDEDEMGEMVAFEDLPPPKPRGRKISVSASSAPIANLKAPLAKIPKSEEEQSSITDMLKQSTIFKHLPATEQATLKDAMAKESFADGEDIITEGTIGDKLYLLKSGEVKAYLAKVGAEAVKTYAPGEAFGELAILYNAARAATCKAVGAVEVWALDQLTFRHVMQSTSNDRRQQYREFLRTMPMFQTLSEYEQLTIADSMSEETFAKDATVFRQGDAGDKFYVVLEGNATCWQRADETGATEQEVGTLQAGSYFGEIALLTPQPRQATVKAEGPLKVLSMEQDTFTRLMGPLVDIMNRNVGSYGKMGEDVIAAPKQVTGTTATSVAPGIIGEQPQSPSSEGTAGIAAPVELPRTRRVSVDFQQQMEDLAKAAAEQNEPDSASDSDSDEDEDEMGEMVAFEDLPPPKPRGRYTSVSASSAPIVMNVPLAKIPKSEEEQSSITDMLKQAVIFSHLPSDAQATLKDAMAKESFADGEDIITEGTIGDKLYLLKSGEVKAYLAKVGAEAVKTYAPGEAFGELAILYNAARAATCKAVGAVEVWALDQLTFRHVMQSTTTSKREETREFLKQVPAFATLTEYEQLTVADSLVEEEHEDGAAIVTEGEEGESFYIIAKGSVVCTQKQDGKDAEVGRLETGAYFGEIALLTTKPRQATVTATRGPTKVYRMRRKDFTRVLGPLVDIMNRKIGTYQGASARRSSVTLVAPSSVS